MPRSTRAGAPRLAHVTTVDMSLSLLLGTELRHDVTAGFEVYGISAPGPFVADIEALGVRHVPLQSLGRAWEPSGDARAGRELFAVLRRLGLDIVHTHTPKAGVLGRVLGRSAAVPVVVNTVHGLWTPTRASAAVRAAVLGVEAFAARFSDVELFQNSEDLDTMAWALRGRHTEVVGNGIDLTRFRFDADGRARLRAELGVGEDDVVVGGVGRRVAEKGLPEYVDMATRLGGRARFVWVGPSDTAKADAVDDHSGAVTFLDLRRDMPAVYSALDVFVLPSHREGFSRSAMEAAACGRAMVLSDIRGCREIGQDGKEVLLVPAGDVGAWTAAVQRLIDDAPERERLGVAAERRARAAFDQEAIAAKSIAWYRQVADEKRLPWRSHPALFEPPPLQS